MELGCKVHVARVEVMTLYSSSTTVSCTSDTSTHILSYVRAERYDILMILL